jgi:DNA (cytosine-5)-methyltransferase 1
MSKPKSIKVIELFAGVGGFRIGLEGYKGMSAISGYTKSLKNKIPFEVVYSNQYEPATPTKQYANDIYRLRFGDKGHIDKDINEVTVDDLKTKCDLMVGGFPCQNYSVASLLRDAKGLIGEKGILWWQIERLINELDKKGKAPKYLLLENVDKLLISPTPRPGEKNSNGKDFAIILSSLSRHGYNVEWRMINAADYGFPQRRRRVFIFAYRQNSKIEKKLKKDTHEKILFESGILARTFPCQTKETMSLNKEFFREIKKDRNEYIKRYSDGSFKNAGIMLNGKVFESQVAATHDYKSGQYLKSTLGEILQPLRYIGKEFIIKDKEIREKWKAQKIGHSKERTAKDGTKYEWKVGTMDYPDSLSKPSRTILTSEGGKSPSRTTHVVKQEGVYRRLSPIELEGLNMFPDNFTDIDSIPSSKRAFLMGNALVIGVVESIGKTLSDQLVE